MPQSIPIFLAGPTAVGKSDVALALAQRVGGEIISVDSMQVYRGLDLGTAKPSPSERAAVPHHLIDVVELDEMFDAARFMHLARQAEAEIQALGRVPIFCGGTGLYFKAYLEGVGQAPPSDLALRAVLEGIPLPELLLELERTDPALFAKIDRQNRRRVVRAIEVIRLTGRPFSEQRAAWLGPVAGARTATSASPNKSVRADMAVRAQDRQLRETEVTPNFFCFRRSPEDLRRRIDERVDTMFSRGLVAEAQGLMERGLEKNPAAQQAIGYRQVVEHLRGERTLEETKALVKQKTRQFAKRQMTWFRHQFQPVWIDLRPDANVDEVASLIAGR